ncbi:MAG: hypothetical protein JRI25_27230, partial [Deltaproteobacteria bacterium]|nr:hypothetical protein [Deltaproteobacteria bacterium]
GGTHDERNLVSLCCTHHGLTHDGLMAVWIRGDRVFFEFLDGRRAEASLGRQLRQDSERVRQRP